MTPETAVAAQGCSGGVAFASPIRPAVLARCSNF